MGLNTNSPQPQQDDIPQHEIERARRVPIEQVLSARGVTLKGKGKHRYGPCPMCNDGTDRFSYSYSVKHRQELWRCRTCAPFKPRAGDVVALVMALDGCSFPEAVATLNGGRWGDIPRRKIKPAADDRRWLTIWNEALPLRCDPKAALGLSYLTRPRAEQGRGLVIPVDLLDGRVLRFHPLHHWRTEAGEVIQVPALIALFRDIITDEAKAIWRRPLTADGRSAGKPKMMGPRAGCAIKLTADEDVTDGLHVGEGPETMLAAMMRGFVPAWALGDAGGVSSFPVLAGIDALTIVVDNDESGAGQQAASACYDRWRDAGREVWCVVPDKVGADMADVDGDVS
jgi:hypothetical protein